MSISSIFNAGVKGMAATQLATQVAANNISNAATVGYVRRNADIQPEQALLGGVKAQRVIEPFLERRLLGAYSGSGEAEAQRVAVEVLDHIFAEGDGSLGSALDAFQVSLQRLSAHPEDLAMRQQVLSTAENLGTAFGNASAELKTARADAAARVNDGLVQVNDHLEQIGRLSVEIQQSEVTGIEASDLRDQRDLLIRKVSERVPVTVIDQGDGRTALLLAGSHQLVSADGKVSELSSSIGSDGSVRISKVAAGASVDVTELVTSGTVGGAMKAREGVLAEVQTRLDQLAYDVAKAYNEVHGAGYDLEGGSGNNLFVPIAEVAGAADAFAVSAEVADAPGLIAAALDSSKLPSDNRNALALAALSYAPIALGGMTVTEALASLVGQAGSAVQNATQAESFATGALEQIQTLREDVSGVSTDEEMVAMMKYQRAYEASLKVIQVADQMLGDLLNIRG